MAEATWIKVSTSLFEDEKIQMIQTLPGGTTHILVWLKLLCFAGKINLCGILEQDGIVYTDTMLATVFRMRTTQVRKALEVFLMYGMISFRDNGAIVLTNWSKHQNMDQLEKRREADRVRKQLKRALDAQSAGLKVTEIPPALLNKTQDEASIVRGHVRNFPQAEKEKEKETEIEKEKETDPLPPDAESVAALFRSLCPSLEPYPTVLEADREVIAYLAESHYRREVFVNAFCAAQESKFLRGENGCGIRACFSWLIRPENMGKVISGQFRDLPKDRWDDPESCINDELRKFRLYTKDIDDGKK